MRTLNPRVFGFRNLLVLGATTLLCSLSQAQYSLGQITVCANEPQFHVAHISPTYNLFTQSWDATVSSPALFSIPSGLKYVSSPTGGVITCTNPPCFADSPYDLEFDPSVGAGTYVYQFIAGSNSYTYTITVNPSSFPSYAYASNPNTNATSIQTWHSEPNIWNGDLLVSGFIESLNGSTAAADNVFGTNIASTTSALFFANSMDECGDPRWRVYSKTGRAIAVDHAFGPNNNHVFVLIQAADNSTISISDGNNITQSFASPGAGMSGILHLNAATGAYIGFYPLGYSTMVMDVNKHDEIYVADGGSIKKYDVSGGSLVNEWTHSFTGNGSITEMEVRICLPPGEVDKAIIACQYHGNGYTDFLDGVSLNVDKTAIVSIDEVINPSTGVGVPHTKWVSQIVDNGPFDWHKLAIDKSGDIGVCGIISGVVSEIFGHSTNLGGLNPNGGEYVYSAKLDHQVSASTRVEWFKLFMPWFASPGTSEPGQIVFGKNDELAVTFDFFKTSNYMLARNWDFTTNSWGAGQVLVHSAYNTGYNNICQSLGLDQSTGTMTWENSFMGEKTVNGSCLSYANDVYTQTAYFQNEPGMSMHFVNSSLDYTNTPTPNSYINGGCGLLYRMDPNASPAGQYRMLENAEELLQQETSAENFAVYPNPITSGNELQMPEAVTRVQVFDITGRTVSEDLSVTLGRTAINLQAGQYVIKAFDENANLVGTSKLLVK